MKKDPCETCLRWSECNGVDAGNCPHYAAELLAQIVEEKTESGLLEE